VTGAGKTVLVVEDTPDVREAIQLTLELEGYRVLTAIHGKDALDQLRGGANPDLVLLDIFMPVMDGREFLERRATERLSPDVPVVVFAAARPEKNLPGVVDWISKPADLDVLLGKIANWIRASH
jgi:CheY-like chemotaxis protein